MATDRQLIQCLVYIDLNMVRAGLEFHPVEWTVSGFHDIQSPPERYRVIDYTALYQLLGMEDAAALKYQHRNWVETMLRQGKLLREPKWTESVAVGPEFFTSKF